jgi:hypothetical protein
MKTYAVGVIWNHKGTKFPRSANVVVEATTFPTAAYRAIKQVKKANRSTWKEPVGSSIRVDIYITDNGRKEAEDGRRGIRELSEEP